MPGLDFKFLATAAAAVAAGGLAVYYFTKQEPQHKGKTCCGKGKDAGAGASAGTSAAVSATISKPKRSASAIQGPARDGAIAVSFDGPRDGQRVPEAVAEKLAEDWYGTFQHERAINSLFVIVDHSVEGVPCQSVLAALPTPSSTAYHIIYVGTYRVDANLLYHEPIAPAVDGHEEAHKKHKEEHDAFVNGFRSTINEALQYLCTIPGVPNKDEAAIINSMRNMKLLLKPAKHPKSQFGLLYVYDKH